MKKSPYLALIFILLLFLAACVGSSGSGGVTTVKAESGYRFVYRSTDEQALYSEIRSIAVMDGRVYFADYSADGIFSVYSSSADAAEIVEIPLPIEYRENIWQVSFSLGDIWLLTAEYDNAEGNYSYSVVRVRTDGSILSETGLDDAVSPGGIIRCFQVDDLGNIFFSVDELITGIDIGESVFLTVSAPYGINALEKTPSGRVIVRCLDDNLTRYISSLDIEAVELVDTVEFALNSFANFYFGSAEYDFLMSDTTKLYGYSLERNEKTELLTFTESNIVRDEAMTICYIDEDLILIWFYDSNARTELSKMVRLPLSEIPNKQTLTYATISLSSEMNSLIVDFNRHSEKYEITVLTYPDRDYSKFDMDIISGKAPDIIDLSNLAMEKYANKGILLDIYELIEQYGDKTRDDFVPGYLNAIEYAGGLYRISPDFYLFTLIGSKNVFGDEIGLNMERFMKILDSIPEDMDLISIYTKSQYLRNLLCHSLDEFVDFDAGVSHFDREKFKTLLYALNTHLSDEEISGYDGDFYAQLRNGEVLFEPWFISSFNDMASAEATYGDNIVYVGYPMVSGSGGVLYANDCFGISSSCEYPEGAWELIELMLSDKYQDSVYYFPVISANLDKKAANVLAEEYKEDYHLDDEGNVTGTIRQTTESDIELAYEIIDGMKVMVSRGYDEIVEICIEEAEYYFSGRKTIDDIIPLIQSRVQIYLDEIQD